jgi:hypothetical protein
LYAKEAIGDMTELFLLRVRIGAVHELAKSIFGIAYVIFLPSKVIGPKLRRSSRKNVGVISWTSSISASSRVKIT